jgi:MFS family permease
MDRDADHQGRRWFFIGGNALATIGCVVAAVAPNIPALIAGETLIGLGAASQLSYACKPGQSKQLTVHDLTISQLLLGSLCLPHTDSWLKHGCTSNSVVLVVYTMLADVLSFAWAIPSSGFAPAIAYAFVFRTSVGWRGSVTSFASILSLS